MIERKILDRIAPRGRHHRVERLRPDEMPNCRRSTRNNDSRRSQVRHGGSSRRGIANHTRTERTLNPSMILAREELKAFEETGTWKTKRTVSCMALCLKPRDNANKDMHKIMFYKLCHCSTVVYTQVLRVFAGTVDYVERNTEVRALLNISSHREIATVDIQRFYRSHVQKIK